MDVPGFARRLLALCEARKNNSMKNASMTKKVASQLPCHSSAPGHKTLFRHVYLMPAVFLCVYSRNFPQNEYGMTQHLHHAERRRGTCWRHSRVSTPPCTVHERPARLPGFDVSVFCGFPA
jgi:hypothetical protein